MKIAVMGAGGIGGYVGGRLAQAGQDVHLIARGQHLAELQRNGLRVVSDDGGFEVADIHVTDDPAQIGKVDIVLFTVKLADTGTAAAALGPMLGADTRIVTVQNGIDSKTMIGAHVGPDRVSAGVIYMAAYVKQPGVITFPGGIQKLVFDGQNENAGLAAFRDACNATGVLDATTTDDPDAVIWQKFVVLSSFSAWTSAARLPIGALRDHPEARAFYVQLLNEAAAVAAKSGHPLEPDAIPTFGNILDSQPATMKSSLLVDIEAGKPTEAAWLCGRVHNLGRELGVATPGHSALWAVLAPWTNGTPALNQGANAG